MWIIEVGLSALVLVGIQFGIRAFLARLEKNHPKGWRAHLSKILKQPLFVLLWVVGGLYIFDIIGANLDLPVQSYTQAAQKAAFIVCLVWVLSRWKSEFEQGTQNTSLQMVGRVATIGVVLIATLIILQIFGINITPLLTFSGVGAAAFGFASKDVIANFCSGIMLHITRPFLIGDQILLPEKNLEGHIEEVGWMRTLLRDKEKRSVYLPNNFFSTLLLVNISRMTHRRIKQLIKLPFSDIGKLSEATVRMKAYLENSPHIDLHYPVHVSLRAFGDSACEIDIDTYSTITDLKRFNQFQQEVLLDLATLLREQHVEFAIPELSIKQEKI